jgi:hypothetical protein
MSTPSTPKPLGRAPVQIVCFMRRRFSHHTYQGAESEHCSAADNFGRHSIARSDRACIGFIIVDLCICADVLFASRARNIAALQLPGNFPGTYLSQHFFYHTLTLSFQAIAPLEHLAPDISQQSNVGSFSRSPIPFDNFDLNAGKQRLRNSKSVSFAPLPSPWRRGMHSFMLFDQPCSQAVYPLTGRVSPPLPEISTFHSLMPHLLGDFSSMPGELLTFTLHSHIHTR